MREANGEYYGAIEAARKSGISLRQLYHWVDHLHVVQPTLEHCGLREFRRFTKRDLETLTAVRELMEAGYTLKAAAERARNQTESS